jgi:hypothetical protein
MRIRYLGMLGPILVTMACKETSPSHAEYGNTAAMQPKAAEAPAPAAASETVKAVLAEYESIRATLADDKTEPIVEHAQKLADTASEATVNANAEQRPHLEEDGSRGEDIERES